MAADAHRKFDEILFADYPKGCDQASRLDKYDLRKWLIGHAVLHGWSWEEVQDDDPGKPLAGVFTHGAMVVTMILSRDGIELGHRSQYHIVEQWIETAA